MQAIALLSRREHSRQELRAKLLAALRQRVREDAAAEAAAQAHSEAVDRALAETPSNGIDDAFAPREAAVSRAQGRTGTTTLTPAGRSPKGIDDAFAPARSGPSRSQALAGARVSVDAGDESPPPEADPETAVETLLDWLAARGYLSDERFVESRVHARAAKQGAALIRQELARHGLALEPEQAAALRESEFARAQALWQRKFGVVAGEPRERARQARFLASRGFAADVVRRIVGGQDEF
jgi:regulatory protein